MICQICYNESRQKQFCVNCHKVFILKLEPNRPGMVAGGGSLSDETSRNLGNNAEQLFFDAYRSVEKPIRCATAFENRKQHYDFIVYEKEKFIKVEVKSMKARNRGEAPDPMIIYIEVFNIDGGPGWIYGEADYIAFQQLNGFILVSRVELLWKVHAFMKSLPYVTRSGLEYTLYGRKNRKDLVMILPISEIFSISDKIILQI